MPSPISARVIGPDRWRSATDTDVAIVPWAEDETSASAPDLNDATGGDIARALETKEFSGRLFETFQTAVTDRSLGARRVLLVGAGKRDGLDADVFRKISTAAG